MLNTILDFFNTMLGATLNNYTIPFIVALCIIFVALRKFLEVMRWDTTLLSYAFKVIVVMLAVEQLLTLAGGISIVVGG